MFWVCICWNLNAVRSADNFPSFLASRFICPPKNGHARKYILDCFSFGHWLVELSWCTVEHEVILDHNNSNDAQNNVQFYKTIRCAVKSFLKGLHSQYTFLVPKWIAFLPAIPFFHLDCDQIRNPFLQSCCIIMCTSGSGGGRGA